MPGSLGADRWLGLEPGQVEERCSTHNFVRPGSEKRRLFGEWPRAKAFLPSTEEHVGDPSPSRVAPGAKRKRENTGNNYISTYSICRVYPSLYIPYIIYHMSMYHIYLSISLY